MPTSAPAGRRILIVEDEAVIAWELQFLLEELGHHVCGIAASEDDAERLAWQTQPELILMDVRLGRGGDGVVAAQRILSARRVPIIFCTAYSDPAVIERMNAVQPVGIANKPIERHILRKLIDAAPA